MKDLNFIPGFIFKKDVPLIDFLGRVGNTDDQNTELGQLEAHPWLNLFVPKSRILDFNAGVFVDIIGRHNQTSGPILFYPFNRKKYSLQPTFLLNFSFPFSFGRFFFLYLIYSFYFTLAKNVFLPHYLCRWDDRMSAVTPDEDIFYTLGLLHTSGLDDYGNFDKQNNEIVKFCENAGIKIKQYLPHYKSKEGWMKHFGPKWNTFQERKIKFDPRMILSPGPKIFTSADYSDM